MYKWTAHLPIDSAQNEWNNLDGLKKTNKKKNASAE